jgi:hypothetical protein
MSIGFQSGLQVATQVLNNIKNSYWVNESQHAVYQIVSWSDFAVPNTDFPYQCTIMVYTPSDQFYADKRQYRGAIRLDGAIVMSNSNDGFVGKLINSNKIQWNDGSIWTRTVIQPTDKMNQYDPNSVMHQASVMNNVFHDRYETTYPQLSRYFPYGNIPGTSTIN